MPEKNTCNTCKYFDRTGMGEGYGHCRRFPPVIVLVDLKKHAATNASEWPQCRDTDTCGEWVRA